MFATRLIHLDASRSFLLLHPTRVQDQRKTAVAETEATKEKGEQLRVRIGKLLPAIATASLGAYCNVYPRCRSCAQDLNG
jgi:hypothetical protein